MNEENLEHALRIISTRRNSARTQQEERIQEIETRIPEVVEINRQLFRTSRNLLEIIRDGGNVSEQVESGHCWNSTAIRQTIWNCTTPVKNARTPAFSRERPVLVSPNWWQSFRLRN